MTRSPRLLYSKLILSDRILERKRRLIIYVAQSVPVDAITPILEISKELYNSQLCPVNHIFLFMKITILMTNNVNYQSQLTEIIPVTGYYHRGLGSFQTGYIIFQ